MARALILRSAGTNCDEETAHAFRMAGAEAELLHVGALLRRERRLDEFDILALPGGFSYGDDLGAGTVLANKLGAHLEDDLGAFVESGRLVIGICNGFQVLVRLGLLPGWRGDKVASLVENESGKFEDRWVRLRVESAACPFLVPSPEGEGRAGTRAGSEESSSAPPPHASGPAGGPGARDAKGPSRRQPGGVIRLPVAHREGRFLVGDPEVVERLRQGGQIALVYAGEDGRPTQEYPSNPNGSVDAIAGITNPRGNVLGLMPHPERHLHLFHQPAWTRRGVAGDAPDSLGDGYFFFESAVRHLEARARVGAARTV